MTSGIEWLGILKILPALRLIYSGVINVCDFFIPPLVVNLEIDFGNSYIEPPFLKITIRNKKNADYMIYDFNIVIGDEEYSGHFLREKPCGYFEHKIRPEEGINVSAKKVETRYVVFRDSEAVREKYEAGSLYFSYKSSHNGKICKINVKEHIEQNKKKTKTPGAGPKALLAGGKNLVTQP